MLLSEVLNQNLKSNFWKEFLPEPSFPSEARAILTKFRKFLTRVTCSIGERRSTMARRKPGTHRARSRVKKKRPEVKSAPVVQSHIRKESSPDSLQAKRSRSGSHERVTAMPVKVGNKVTLPRPNAIIMKIFGVLASYKFEKEMIEYGKNNLRGYLQRRWTKDKIIPHLVTRLVIHFSPD